MLPDLHIGFSRGRSGDLVFPSLSEFSTVYCGSQRLWHSHYAEIDVFLELSCFFHDPADVGNLNSGSSAFSKTRLNIWKFTVHILLKPGWRILMYAWTSFLTFNSISLKYMFILTLYHTIWLLLPYSNFEISYLILLF